jgi:hypothetical protein
MAAPADFSATVALCLLVFSYRSAHPALNFAFCALTFDFLFLLILPRILRMMGVPPGAAHDHI